MFKLEQSLRQNCEAILKTKTNSASTVDQLSASRQELSLRCQALPGEKGGWGGKQPAITGAYTSPGPTQRDGGGGYHPFTCTEQQYSATK